MIVDELKNSEFLKVYIQADRRGLTKTFATSERSRKEGNDLYLQGKHTAIVHEDILRLYNSSIATAPLETEAMALGHGNKSAFLLHLKKYRESIEEIEKALRITKSDSLKEKLGKRRMECYNNLMNEQNQVS